jgi:elongation factor Ts
VGELVTEKIASIKENISVRRFTRYKMGEGIEKKSDDFASEVASMVG